MQVGLFKDVILNVTNNSSPSHEKMRLNDGLLSLTLVCSLSFFRAAPASKL